jgi:hypothetical protein
VIRAIYALRDKNDRLVPAAEQVRRANGEFRSHVARREERIPGIAFLSRAVNLRILGSQ